MIDNCHKLMVTISDIRCTEYYWKENLLFKVKGPKKVVSQPADFELTNRALGHVLQLKRKETLFLDGFRAVGVAHLFCEIRCNRSRKRSPRFLSVHRKSQVAWGATLINLEHVSLFYANKGKKRWRTETKHFVLAQLPSSGNYIFRD